MTTSIDTTPLSASHDIPLVTGLSKIMHRYDGVILDLFGVLHNGIEPYPGTIPALKALKAEGKPVVLLSNTPKLSIRSAEDLRAMGITDDLYDRLITAGDAAHEALRDKYDDFHASCGRACWFMGPEKMAHILEELNFDVLDGPEGASFILNSMPGTENESIDDLENMLKRAAEMDLPMVCANPDLVVNIGDNQFKCAGTFARFYEDKGGRVAYHGKPYTRVYEMAQEILQISDPSRILAVGDSLHTDIQGAQNFGIDGIFNLVGIHREEVLMDDADEIDLEKVRLVLANQPHTPIAVMEGLTW